MSLVMFLNIEDFVKTTFIPLFTRYDFSYALYADKNFPLQ